MAKSHFLQILGTYYYQLFSTIWIYFIFFKTLKIEIYHKLESLRQYNTNSRYSLRKMLIWIKLLIDQISFFVNYRCDFYYTKSVFLSEESNFMLREKFETIFDWTSVFLFSSAIKVVSHFFKTVFKTADTNVLVFCGVK